MKFIKYSATGNDFIVIDNRENIFPEHNKEWVQKLCQRRLGVGADGILVLNAPKKDEDFFMVILNADGSRPSMCGNGTRAMVHFAHFLLKLKDSGQYHFTTDNGTYFGEIIGDEVKVQMTERYDEFVPDQGLYPKAKNLFHVNTGVPHLVLELDDIEAVDLNVMAPPLRSHKDFKDGVNVDIFEVLDAKAKRAKLRTFERGVEGETLACGTGVLATALALKHHHNWDGEIEIETKGGVLKTILEADQMFFQGAVSAIFQGELCEK